jgi:hypothetical protein
MQLPTKIISVTPPKDLNFSPKFGLLKGEESPQKSTENSEVKDDGKKTFDEQYKFIGANIGSEIKNSFKKKRIQEKLISKRESARMG